MPRINKEKIKLRKALKEFNELQKQILYEKVDEGFTGWDDPDMMNTMENNLCELAADIDELYMRGRKSTKENEAYRRKCLHIANFAMFLYHGSKA